MTTNQTNSVANPVGNPPININQNISQLLIDNIAINYISKLMNETNMNVFSIKTFTKIILILSIDEIRKGITNTILLGKEYAPTALKYIWTKITLLILFTKKIPLLFAKKSVPPPLITHSKKKTGSCYNFEWNNMRVYSKLIYNLITNDKNAKYNKFYGKKIDTHEHGKHLYSINYRDVKIQLDDDKFLEIDKITLNSDMTLELPEEKQFDCLSDYLENHGDFQVTLKSCTDILFMQFIKKYGSDRFKYGSSNLCQLDGCMISFNYTQIDVNTLPNVVGYPTENICLMYIMNAYPQLDARKVYIELQLILYHRVSLIKNFKTCQLEHSQEKSAWAFYMFYYFSKLQFTKLKKVHEMFTEKNLAGGCNVQGNAIHAKYKDMEIEEKIKEKNHSNNTTNVKITSSIQYSDEQLINTFLKFLETNNHDTWLIQKGKEIHIYELKLSIKKNITKVDNPEYTSWKEFKDEIIKNDTNSTDKKDSANNKEKDRFSIHLPKAPPQFFEKEVIEKEVIKTDINETFKSMDTLYLPQNVSSSLLKILNNFMNKKSGLFTRLGIPNKLGICLYGKPGTGKSTTIKVIGSYLGKDIYYINMNGITKNSELKQMFDFVVRKQCDGGIIVFEDLDCACNIVKPRQQQINENNPFSTDKLTNIVADSDELSLSYLLNLLDGTLCAKNTMFIITTNHINHLDKALIRPGRCDITIELKECDKYQINRIWESVMEQKLDEKILNSIPEYKFTPAELIFHLIEYIYQDNVKPEEIFDALNKKITHN